MSVDLSAPTSTRSARDATTLGSVLLERDEEMHRRLNSFGNARGNVYSAFSRDLIVENAIYEAGRGEPAAVEERVHFTLCRSGGGCWTRRSDELNYKATMSPGAIEVLKAARNFVFEWPKMGLTAITVSTPRFNRICADIGLADGSSVFQDTRVYRDPLVEQAILATAAHADSHALSALFIDHVVGLIVMQLRSTGSPRRDAVALSSRQFDLVVSYMRERLADDMALTELSSLVNLSVSEFSRRFRATAGAPPYAFLTALRMREAQYLIRSSTLSIGEIGLIVGYLDTRQFSRVFQKFSGHPPARWRRMNAQ